MKEEAILTSTAIVDPPPWRTVALVSDGQIVRLDVLPTAIRLGTVTIEYVQMMSRRVTEEGLLFWDGKRMVRFGIQGYQSKGTVDWELTCLLNQLIDAAAGHDEKQIAEIVQIWNSDRRIFALRNLIMVLVVILFGGSLPLVAFIPGSGDFVMNHPAYALLGFVLVAGGLVPLFGLYLPRLLWKMKRRRTMPRTAPAPRDGALSGDD